MRKLPIHLMLLLSLTGFLTGASAQQAPLKTVPYVNLQKYMGTWYEIARLPMRSEKGCHCSKATYSLEPGGEVTVINECRRNSPGGELDMVKGKAAVEDTATNAKLKVQFVWPFRGDYWIMELAGDYSYAVVGHPSRKYFWILSRTPAIDSGLLQSIKERAQAQGFDLSRLLMTDQSCDNEVGK